MQSGFDLLCIALGMIYEGVRIALLELLGIDDGSGMGGA